MCVLLAGAGAHPFAIDRLRAFARTDDGFELAEVDLRTRGPGDFLGVRQAGQAEFRFGDVLRHADLLHHARADARHRVLGQGDVR